MPRGVRNSTDYSAQISQIDEKIQKYTERITNLKDQKQELLSRQRDADMQELYSYMQENDLSARDILTQLTPVQEPAVAASWEQQPENV